VAAATTARRPARAAKAAAPPVRRRRTPDDARRELLAAAERVFAAHPPDAVGLKEIARAAGVSHALITHYFGTYGGLVDAVLARRLDALRDAVLARVQVAGALARPGELLAILFAALEDPVHKRLWIWSLAGERASAQDFLPLHHEGLRQLAVAIASAIGAEHGGHAERLLAAVEQTLLLGLAAAYGYAIGKPALVGALGRVPSPAFDRELQDTLGEMMREHLRRVAAGQGDR
jgi:AcrR family transcriptional regulator